LPSRVGTPDFSKAVSAVLRVEMLSAAVPPDVDIETMRAKFRACLHAAQFYDGGGDFAVFYEETVRIVDDGVELGRAATQSWNERLSKSAPKVADLETVVGRVEVADAHSQALANAAAGLGGTREPRHASALPQQHVEDGRGSRGAFAVDPSSAPTRGQKHSPDEQEDKSEKPRFTGAFQVVARERNAGCIPRYHWVSNGA
jgi:hypothetical protein